MGKTLEGEETPFRRWSLLPPNLPHPPRTSPISPPLTKRKFVSFFVSGGDMGEVFVGWGGAVFLKGAASRPICLRCCLQDFLCFESLAFLQ